jgi:hypothetical protein
MRSDKPSKPSASPDQSSIEPDRVDISVSVGLPDLFKIQFTPAAIAAFHAGGRRLDSLIEIAAAKAADIRATLREIIASHPTTGQIDAANLAMIIAILASLS